MIPGNINTSHVYTNSKGRFRVVTGFRKVGEWKDVHYVAAYQNTKGKMKPGGSIFPNCGVNSFAEWADREATPSEALAVLAVLTQHLSREELASANDVLKEST